MGDLALHRAYGIEDDFELWHDHKLIMIVNGRPGDGSRLRQSRARSKIPKTLGTFETLVT